MRQVQPGALAPQPWPLGLEPCQDDSREAPGLPHRLTENPDICQSKAFPTSRSLGGREIRGGPLNKPLNISRALGPVGGLCLLPQENGGRVPDNYGIARRVCHEHWLFQNSRDAPGLALHPQSLFLKDCET